ncbi:hypothetical protein SUGI_0189910 [Cryptomeria japonica]|nr:hypothetical protein SUGI_0189910 [Cryptomeria japonica]
MSALVTSELVVDSRKRVLIRLQHALKPTFLSHLFICSFHFHGGLFYCKKTGLQYEQGCGQEVVELDEMFVCSNGERRDFKKVCHNANERQRRKKLNALYATLRSLLPRSNKKKNLSIPAVVCGVLEYIPWLQKRIEILALKRDELLAIRKISHRSNDGLRNEANFEQHLEQNYGVLFDVRVNMSAMAKAEDVVITVESPPFLFSDLLVLFMQDNLDLLNASMFVSNGIVLHTIHLKVMKSSSLLLGALRSKIQIKNLSIPAVVCGVLEYIPWLQKRIEILALKRDELLAIRKFSQRSNDGLRNEANFEQHLEQNYGVLFDVRVNMSAMATTEEVVITVESPPFVFSDLLVLFMQENLDLLNTSMLKIF